MTKKPEPSPVPVVRPFFRYAAGFFGIMGLIASAGAAFGMYQDPANRADIAGALAVALFGTFIGLFVAITGRPPNFMFWTNKKLR
ncbi:MAG: hypothetical protein EOP11_21730 [Proteobacteria bacterium]|nr:MAG: hypothetical protein EOP11_21730 [Pseudomonadota bacterium]